MGSSEEETGRRASSGGGVLYHLLVFTTLLAGCWRVGRSGLVLVVVFVEDVPAEADEVEKPRLLLCFGSVESAHAAAAVGKGEDDGLTLDGIGTALRSRMIKVRIRHEHLIEDSVIEKGAVGHELDVLPRADESEIIFSGEF